MYYASKLSNFNTMPLPIPKAVPKAGFYYHYKHDKAGDFNNYAYEVIAVGFHTEDDARSGEEHFVLYRPLYSSTVYMASLDLKVPCVDCRPLEMWMGDVEVEGETVPRFSLIIDKSVIGQLKAVRDHMYPETKY